MSNKCFDLGDGEKGFFFANPFCDLYPIRSTPGNLKVVAKYGLKACKLGLKTFETKSLKLLQFYCQEIGIDPASIPEDVYSNLRSYRSTRGKETHYFILNADQEKIISEIQADAEGDLAL